MDSSSNISSPFGKIFILEITALYEETLRLIEEAGLTPATIALTGGSTPKAFYQWVVQKNGVYQGANKAFENITWTTSDERYVPLSSEESNFGTADRVLLQALHIAEEKKSPWPVEFEPLKAAQVFNERFPKSKPFDLCFLGMGEDYHTASLFPNSPLMLEQTTGFENFAAVLTENKGWRLTLTPKGLERCGKIIVTLTGKGKAEVLKNLFKSPLEPLKKPIQLLKAFSSKVTWLVDKDAASLLEFPLF